MTHFKYTKGRNGQLLPSVTIRDLKSIKRGLKIWATEDIHSSGEVIIKRHSIGIIVSRGPYALNVQFDGYPSIVLCLWDMVEPVNMSIQPTLFDMEEEFNK